MESVCVKGERERETDAQVQRQTQRPRERERKREENIITSHRPNTTQDRKKRSQMVRDGERLCKERKRERQTNGHKDRHRDQEREGKREEKRISLHLIDTTQRMEIIDTQTKRKREKGNNINTRIASSASSCGQSAGRHSLQQQVRPAVSSLNGLAYGTPRNEGR